MTQRFETSIIAEGTTGVLTLTSDGSTITLLDVDDSVIPVSAVDSITMTLIELKTGDTINSRSAQDVLNTNNCTMTEAGLFTWDVQKADTSIVNTNIPENGIEYHLATFTFVWDSGAEQLSFEILMPIRNLRSVT